MANENKVSLVKICSAMLQSIFKLFKDISQLANAEAHLAKQSLVNLFVMLIVFGALLSATWLCVTGLLVAFLVSIQLSLVLSLMIAIALNLLLLGIVGFIMLKLKENLFFPATRKQLSRTRSLLKDSYHEQVTEKN